MFSFWYAKIHLLILLYYVHNNIKSLPSFFVLKADFSLIQHIPTTISPLSTSSSSPPHLPSPPNPLSLLFLFWKEQERTAKQGKMAYSKTRGKPSYRDWTRQPGREVCLLYTICLTDTRISWPSIIALYFIVCMYQNLFDLTLLLNVCYFSSCKQCLGEEPSIYTFCECAGNSVK